MAKFRLGCVPYVNAAPLVWWFESLGENSPVEIFYDVPSRLPALLDEGAVDAILVSSIYALTHPGLNVADGVGIVSSGPVESVRVLSNVPYGNIQSLALDSSSMTSNLLALILLKEQFGVVPATLSMQPDPQKMLEVCDACVVIGDIGMTAHAPGSRVLDLGEAWTDSTGLPFIWALWVGKERLDSELAGLLTLAHKNALGAESWEKVIQFASTKVEWDVATVDRYLTTCVQCTVTDSAKEGLNAYASKVHSVLRKEGLRPIQWVAPAQSTTPSA
ncbi:menaquinone biosynthesis protein [Kamptonema cortianum]|nr:menaquinone biosynthesis protein [Geitlerinema splendidum]MDK3161195.1 menaquinone biosynthesis protein [Kamptonema cortianum]